MEKSFTRFCILFAVIFSVAAVAISANGFSVVRCAGTGIFAFGALGYILFAILCSRKLPNITA